MTEIRESMQVQVMCHHSLSFESKIKALYSIDKEIMTNNKLASSGQQQVASFSEENNSLKKTKLQMKKEIQAEIFKYTNDQRDWLLKNSAQNEVKKQKPMPICTSFGIVPTTINLRRCEGI